MIWNDTTIIVDPPKKPKKITGTRFATVMGLNPWSTPFEIWCAVTKTYEKPFEDTIYTIAGKTIEPKQAEYMKKAYAMNNLVTPERITSRRHGVTSSTMWIFSEVYGITCSTRTASLRPYSK